MIIILHYHCIYVQIQYKCTYSKLLIIILLYYLSSFFYIIYYVVLHCIASKYTYKANINIFMMND